MAPGERASPGRADPALAGIRAGLLRVLALAGGRLLWAAASLAGAVALIQAMVMLAPGDAIDLLPDAERLRPLLAQEWGLDQPFAQRLWTGVARVATGDLGHSLSYQPGRPVAELLLLGGRSSLGLLLPAMIAAVGGAVGLGWAGLRWGWVRRWVRGLSVIPAFLTSFGLISGINALCWAMMEAGWIARPGWFTLPDAESVLRDALAALVLGWASGTLAGLHRQAELDLQALLSAPFVDAARAIGAPVWPVVARNLLPVTAGMAAAALPAILGGLVVVEKLFLRNGAGAMLWEACRLRDYPLVTGLAVGAAAVVCAGGFGSDLLRLWSDPRLRTP